MAVAVLKQNTHCNFRHNFDLQGGSWHFDIDKGRFLAEISIFGSILGIRPSMALTRPIYTHPAGWRGYNFPEKLAESKFGMLWGYFSARNSNFWSTLYTRPSTAVTNPIYTHPAGWRGYNLPPKWWRTKYVCFGESAPYGGHPPHIYPSNRVDGVQVTAKMDGPPSRILRPKILRQHTARIFRNFCGKLYPSPSTLLDEYKWCG